MSKDKQSNTPGTDVHRLRADNLQNLSKFGWVVGCSVTNSLQRICPHGVREMKQPLARVGVGCIWKKTSLNLPLQEVEEWALSHLEGVEPSSFVAPGDRRTACPGDTQATTKSCDVLVEHPEGERHTTFQRKKEAEALELATWPDCRNFWIWRMTFRSDVSSGASRPVEGMVCMSEIDSAKSIADLKMSNTITWAKL